MKKAKFKKGSKVQWRWLGRTISGKIEKVFFEPVTIVLKNSPIKRNGSPTRPAYLVRSQADNLALKLETELQKWARGESAWKDRKPSS